MTYIKTTWEDEPSESTPINASNLNKIENGIYQNSINIDKLSNKIGKLLWEGSFTSGSITVDGISNYTIIICNIGGCMCIGSRYYGLGGVGMYGQYSSQIYNYRFNVSGETLTIDSTCLGGSNGSENVPVTKIYGLF